MASFPARSIGWLGATTGARLAAAASLLSAIVYFVSSAAVRHERNEWAYRQSLFAMFRNRPSLHSLYLDHPLEARAVLLVVAFFLICTAAGILAARLGRRGVAHSDEALTWGLAVAVAPALLVATVAWPDGRHLLDAPLLLVATTATTLLLVLFCSRESARVSLSPVTTVHGDRDALTPLWSWLWVIVVVPLFTAALLNGFVEIRGFDSFGYHLPLAASWLRRARIITGPEATINLFYPGNFEWLLRWTLQLGTDRFAFILSWGSALLSLWLVRQIARELGQPRHLANISACAAATTQVFVLQSTTVYSDTFTAMLLLLAVLLLLRWLRTAAADTRLLAAVGLALGLAVGTKYSALPPALVLVLVCLWNIARGVGDRAASDARRRDRRWALGQLAALGVPALLTAGYWYVRNAIEHGNPLYPVSVAGLPGVAMGYLIAVRPELAAPSWRWLAYPWGEFGFNQGTEDGLGPAFAAVALIGFAALPLARWSHWQQRPRVRLLWWITLFSYLLWLQTGILVPRYGLFPILLTYIFVGELWLVLGSRLLQLVTAACLIAGSAFLTRALLVGTVYVELIGARRTGVAAVVDSLPPATILNVAGQPAGYHALGRDYRHTVITLYRDATPDDVRRYHPDYLLLADRWEPTFTAALPLTLIARYQQPTMTPTSLWKVGTAEPTQTR